MIRELRAKIRQQKNSVWPEQSRPLLAFVVHPTQSSYAVVSSRPILETVEVLRRTLIEVERDLDPVTDASALNALKRIVMNRIAELELLQAQQSRAGGRFLRPLPTTLASAGAKPQMDFPAPDVPKKA